MQMGGSLQMYPRSGFKVRFHGHEAKNIDPVTWIQMGEGETGRKAPHVLTLSNHKSFSEPLIHFTKQAVL